MIFCDLWTPTFCLHSFDTYCMIQVTSSLVVTSDKINACSVYTQQAYLRAARVSVAPRPREKKTFFFSPTLPEFVQNAITLIFSQPKNHRLRCFKDPSKADDI